MSCATASCAHSLQMATLRPSMRGASCWDLPQKLQMRVLGIFLAQLLKELVAPAVLFTPFGALHLYPVLARA